MKRWTTLVVGLTLLGLYAGPVPGQIWDNAKLVEKLELTDEQVEQLQASAVERQKSAIQLRSQIEMAELELEQLWQAETLDEGRILDHVRELAKLRQQQMVERARQRLHHMEILTPEQQEQVRAFPARRRGRAKAREEGQGFGQRRRRMDRPCTGVGPRRGPGPDFGPQFGPPPEWGGGLGGPRGRQQAPGFRRGNWQ